jgi:nitrogenase-stabilizing/protective protein
MGILKTFQGLSSAEDFFKALDVAYDPKVLQVCRLHILRRMGEYMRNETFTADAPEAEIRAQCSAFLTRAYADFIRSTPLEERVFKVLKDAVKPKRQAFVSLGSLTSVKAA